MIRPPAVLPAGPTAAGALTMAAARLERGPDTRGPFVVLSGFRCKEVHVRLEFPLTVGP